MTQTQVAPTPRRVDGVTKTVGRRTLTRGGAVGIIAVALALFAGSVAEANLGDLDTTFGNAGKQTLDLGRTGTSDIDFGGAETMSAMVAQPDGKLVLVGSTPGSGGGDFAIARLNADGTPDSTFSGDGRQTVDFGGADIANAVAIQPDGKIVIAGQGGGGNDMAVARLTSTGGLDTSFGSRGKHSSTSAAPRWRTESRFSLTAALSLRVPRAPRDLGTSRSPG